MMSVVNERNLATIREVYRLSCEDVGALMGVSGRFVSYVEQGARNLPTYRADLLAKELALTHEKVTRLTEIYEMARSSERPAALFAGLI
ncbi:hypothetical protein DFP95_11192 [Cohnella lupini]|uniref:Helix-turn-helix protein n=1 Tax=Cohnella lupini TaxID=1294267 RepID=A0A3D9I5Y2_9BACL|nr:hypothetical protein DFP95_11192 [Cohnella lupini]